MEWKDLVGRTIAEVREESDGVCLRRVVVGFMDGTDVVIGCRGDDWDDELVLTCACGACEPIPEGPPPHPPASSFSRAMWYGRAASPR